MTVDLTEAAAQLRRLLMALPALEGGEAYSIAEVAEKVGASVDIVARDLRTLVTRTGDEPGGFFERIQLLFDADQVQLQSNLLTRPMGLTPSELRAIELGLAMLEREVPPEEAALVARARDRVRESAVRNSRRARRANTSDAAQQPDAARIASFETADAPPAHIGAVRDAIARQRKARIQYQSAEAEEPTARTVRPYGLVFSGRWYLVAFCESRENVRVFRVDRISAIDVLDDEESTIPDAFSLDDVLKHGRALANEASERVRIRYAPHIARWIVEHETGEWEVDGSFTVDHPLLDDRWAVRHVLQYGVDAEVLAPERIRRAVVERLQAVLGESVEAAT